MKLIFLIVITLFTQNIMGQQTGNFSSKEPNEKANIKFIGEYYAGQYQSNGTRRSRHITGFKVKGNISGNIQVKDIEINPNTLFLITTQNQKNDIKTKINGNSHRYSTIDFL